MTLYNMKKITEHFDYYFGQTDSTVLHPAADGGHHVDVLLYRPGRKYPFWKLVTMGASDYKMPRIANTVSRYNEYVMFVHGSEDLTDKDVVGWYYQKLMMIASFARLNQTHITYAHSLEWENADPDDEMIAAFIEFPQVMEDVDVLRCRLGLFRTAACLQVILLNKTDLHLLKKIGPQAFSEYLYPDEEGKQHFLAERHRSERF